MTQLDHGEHSPEPFLTTLRLSSRGEYLIYDHGEMDKQLWDIYLGITVYPVGTCL